jgi:hypothetical protein
VRLNSYKYIYKAFTLRELDRVLQHIFCYKKKKKKIEKKKKRKVPFDSAVHKVRSRHVSLIYHKWVVVFHSCLIFPLLFIKETPTLSSQTPTLSCTTHSFIHSFTHSPHHLPKPASFIPHTE